MVHILSVTKQFLSEKEKRREKKREKRKEKREKENLTGVLQQFVSKDLKPL